MTVDAYWLSLNQAVNDVDVDDSDIVIFVHGYNVSFEEAALRAAQIGFDLAIKGAMTFFSRPVD
jgi:esterase/lipase superfamily enzyme